MSGTGRPWPGSSWRCSVQLNPLHRVSQPQRKSCFPGKYFLYLINNFKTFNRHLTCLTQSYQTNGNFAFSHRKCPLVCLAASHCCANPLAWTLRIPAKSSYAKQHNTADFQGALNISLIAQDHTSTYTVLCQKGRHLFIRYVSLLVFFNRCLILDWLYKDQTKRLV